MGFLKLDIPNGYDNRNRFARAGVTELEIAPIAKGAMHYGMLTKTQFLQEVESKASTRAEIAEVLGLSRPAVTGLYNGGRDLSYAEAVKLADHYGIDPNKVSEEKLMPVLRICLRHAPAEWSDHSVARLAEEIVFGLELLRFASPIEPSEDAIEVAARAIADRFRDKPA